MKKIKHLVFIFLLINLYITPVFAENTILQDIKKFETIFIRIIRQHISNPDASKVLKGAIEGMIKALDDPYTVYFEEKESEQFQEKIKSHFGGIGVSIGSYKDEKGDTYLQVMNVDYIKNSPARKAGVIAKDVILKIDEVNAKNMSFEQAKNLLRGEVGTQVQLTVRRFGDNSDSPVNDIEYSITREEIEIQQAYSKILTDTIGYLRLDSFTELASKEVKENLIQLVDSGVTGIIFDLRSNPGGLLTAAVEIVGFLTEGKKKVVYTKDKEGAITSEYFTDGNPICGKMPLILLVNEYSASASEIVTGALKAYKRAVVVGVKTFGKGSVQNLIPLNDKSSLKLTNAYYYTPADVCIHKIGIEPDVQVLLDNSKTDNQLDFALKILKAYLVLK